MATVGRYQRAVKAALGNGEMNDTAAFLLTAAVEVDIAEETLVESAQAAARHLASYAEQVASFVDGRTPPVSARDLPALAAVAEEKRKALLNIACLLLGPDAGRTIVAASREVK